MIKKTNTTQLVHKENIEFLEQQLSNENHMAAIGWLQKSGLPEQTAMWKYIRDCIPNGYVDLQFLVTWYSGLTIINETPNSFYSEVLERIPTTPFPLNRKSLSGDSSFTFPEPSLEEEESFLWNLPNYLDNSSYYLSYLFLGLQLQKRNLFYCCPYLTSQ